MLVLRRYIGESITITNDDGINIIVTLLKIKGFTASILCECKTNEGSYAIRVPLLRHFGDDEQNSILAFMPSPTSPPISFALAGSLKGTCARIGIGASKEYTINRTEHIDSKEAERIEDAKAAGRANTYAREIQEQQ